MPRLILRISILFSSSELASSALAQTNATFSSSDSYGVEKFLWWFPTGGLASNAACDNEIDSAIKLNGNVGLCDDEDGETALKIVNGGGLDLNGYKVFCEDTNRNAQLPDDGILVGADNSTVKNGTVSHCDDGVDVKNNGNNIWFIKAINNQDDGIDREGDDNTLRYNTVSGNNEDDFEINHDDRTLSNNYAYHNNDDGFGYQ